MGWNRAVTYDWAGGFAEKNEDCEREESPQTKEEPKDGPPSKKLDEKSTGNLDTVEVINNALEKVKGCEELTGPRTGPKVDPIVAYAIYFPLSARVATSAVTAWANANVPLLPALCKHRKTSKAV